MPRPLPTDLVFTNDGSQTIVTGTLLNGLTELVMHHNDYEPSRVTITEGDAIYLNPLNGAIDLGYIFNDNLATPLADQDALWEELLGFFSVTAEIAATLTYAQLQQKITDSELGQYFGNSIFISDLPGTDRGGFLQVTGDNLVSPEGVGNYLNAVLGGQASGLDTGIVTVTTVAPTTYEGQWELLSAEAFNVFSSAFIVGMLYTPIGGSFSIGDIVSDGSGWVGEVTFDNGVDNLKAKTTAGTYPVALNTLDNGTGGTATIDIVSTGIDIGATITDQYGWSGIVVLTDNISYIQVYSVTNNMPVIGSIIGDTELDAVGNKTSLIGRMYSFIDPAFPQKGYQLYELVSPDEQNGLFPNTAAYQVLPRGTFVIEYDTTVGSPIVRGDALHSASNAWQGWCIGNNGTDKLYVATNPAISSQTYPTAATTILNAGGVDSVHKTGLDLTPLNLGYIPVSRPIKFDITNGVVYYCKEGTNSVLCAYAQQQTLGYSVVDTFPWGNPAIHDNTVDEGDWKIYNSLAVEIADNEIGYSTTLDLTMQSNSALYGLVMESNSIFGPTTVVEGMSVSNVRILPGIEWSPLAIGANIDGMLVSVSDTPNVVVLEAPFNNIGQITKTFDITGQATLDLGGYVRLDFVILTGGATETLTAITNAPTSGTFKLMPSAGLELTLTGTAYGGAANSIALLTSMAGSLVIDGDFAENAIFAFDGNQSVIQSTNSGMA